MIDTERQVPAGWATAPIGDLCQLINGRGFKKSEWVNSGLPIIRIQNLKDSDASFNYFDGEYNEKILIPPGELLFAWSGTPGTSFGAFSWKGPTGLLNQHIFRVVLDDEYLDRNFFRLAMNERLNSLIDSAQGGVGLRHVTKGTLTETEVLMPPLNEQRRIVAKVEALQERSQSARAALEAISPLLEKFRQSVLAAAFRGDLTADWRAHNPDVEPASELLARIRTERRACWEAAELVKMKAKGKEPKNDKWKEKYKSHELPDESVLPELPSGWCWVALPELGEMGRGKSKHRPRNDPDLYGGSYPFVQTGDVAAANGRVVEHSQTYNEKGLSQSKLWPEGTVCITIAANIADSALLSYPACFPDSIVGIVPEDALASGEFLELFIRSAKADLTRFAPSTAQKNINLGTLAQIFVPLPPKEELETVTQVIERLFTRADATSNQTELLLREIENLFQSVLHKAFQGRLVMQDPNDEPAANLLEKVRFQKSIVSKRGRAAENSVATNEAVTVMKEKFEIIPIKQALTRAGTRLSGQDLLSRSGYPADASTEVLESFFLDIRDELDAGTITREQSKSGAEDWFELVSA